MSLCGDVDAAGIRMPLHRFAGTIRRNKHRDDRARGRLQNPLAHNDVRAGEPSRRWEARWNKWKGQQGPERSFPCPRSAVCIIVTNALRLDHPRSDLINVSLWRR